MGTINYYQAGRIAAQQKILKTAGLEGLGALSGLLRAPQYSPDDPRYVASAISGEIGGRMGSHLGEPVGAGVGGVAGTGMGMLLSKLLKRPELVQKLSRGGAGAGAALGDVGGYLAGMTELPEAILDSSSKKAAASTLQKNAILDLGIGLYNAHKQNPEDPRYLVGGLAGMGGGLLGAAGGGMAGAALGTLSKNPAAQNALAQLGGLGGMLYGSNAVSKQVLGPPKTTQD